MKLAIFYMPLTAILFWAACTPQPQTEEAALPPQLFSEGYKPATFENDARTEKIKAIAPDLQQLVENHIEERHIPGMAYGIVVDGELVLSGSAGLMNIEKELPSTTQSVYRIASMTKSFTAMAILKLRDEGKLSLDEPVVKYIPEVGQLQYLTKDAPTIDIENLLTMTAGFPEDNPWGDRQLDEPDQMLMDLVSDGISFSNPPSYYYEYSNTGYALLGNIVSRVSGQPYQQYINENIFVPLGMNNTYWEYEDVPADELAIGYRWEDDQWKLEPMLHDGSFGAMGGLITTIEDFSKYVSFHLSAWPPRDDADNGPVRRSTLREMHTPKFPRLNANNRNYKDEPCASMTGYGYGLSIVRDCEGRVAVSHGGALPGFGSNYTFFPHYGIGVMAFGNLTYTSPWPTREVIGRLILDEVDPERRRLPISDILRKRQEQVADLIQNWDEQLEAEIIAENLYLDRSREKRKAAIEEVLAQAGAITSVEDINPYNQLRGRFEMKGENGTVRVFFSLSPEKVPKVQRLFVWFVANE